MKRYKLVTLVVVLAGALLTTSCGDDFLTASSTEKQEAGGAATEGAILSNLASAYQILLFDSYADNNYNAVLLMSDLRSDDLYKGGGDAGDQRTLYLLSQFTSTSAETLSGLWSIYFTGLARCNNVIIACEKAVDVDTDKLEQYKAEAHFLRAYYVHLLWKFFGNVPYFEEPLTTPPYMTAQLKADEIYTKIMADIDFACAEDRLPMSYPSGNIHVGRVTKAAALMLKARVVMYQKDQARYAEVTNDMATIIKSGEFALMEDFDAMWLDENEFCKESIFESNQLPEGKTWSTGWQGYGTNLPAFISPNDLSDPDDVFKGGWGFGPVRQGAYDMYESGDLRRDASINKWPEGSYAIRFQSTGLFQRKYAARVGYNPPPGDTDLNYCNNLRIFRFAETLLNYVELVKMNGQAEAQGISAQESFDKIRERAFGEAKSIPATDVNIKLERRREFLGEGMRFWDLVRWGDAAAVLTENTPAFNSTRTFEDWMKYLPIPQGEMEKTKGSEYELVQNGQWK
ncbi:RagB/SusD family nutrient uptake outer membrane protein [Bacteroides sp. 214]|uniref:RagB/SusD family nutrient uptake outer membrane protein n=1 Tax=Bacteroides sp. 214 TaxID=2302935 RepID=UPI0013D2B308|nr:RagB/SusD family nutrient uptake outer membrane protein [Bacteroides sp. 214]NDW13872.1 RagB/SusD family nutrient uptake outer membrane protein [Bacteroides sp. 214]